MLAGAVVFVVLVCVLIGTTVWQTWNARQTELLQAQTAMDNMARSLSQQAGDTIKAADVVLVVLTQLFQGAAASPKDSEDLHVRSVRSVAELPQIITIIIVDAQGRAVLNSIAPSAKLTQPTDYADRAYFAYHRGNLDQNAHIGPPLRARSTGAWAITVSRRINKPDGSFAGVAAASIDMNYFQGFYDTFKIGSKGTISLYSNDAVLLARRPFVEANMAQINRNAPLFRDHLPKAPVGFFSGVSSIDGLERFVSYRKLTRYPLVLAVSMTTDEVLEQWWAETKRVMAMIGVLTLGFAVAGFYLVQQIRRRAQTEAECVTAHDALEAANQQLQELASTDALTGLANRRQFDVSMDAEFRRARRDGTSLALVLIDIDHFKKYNDLYGHPAGDQCLREVAGALAAYNRRPGDSAARYGGEEFAMLLPHTDVPGAMVVAEGICSAIRDQQIDHSGNPPGHVTASAGVSAIVPSQGRLGVYELIQTADKALYEAKAAGRDRIRATSAASSAITDATGLILEDEPGSPLIPIPPPQNAPTAASGRTDT